MGQDIKKLFDEAPEMVARELPKGHKSRFEERLEEEFPKQKPSFSWMNIAASIAIIISLGITGFNYFSNEDTVGNGINSMADISPDLKKVEDYYLSHINYQFSKIKITDENRSVLEGYFVEMGALQESYVSTMATIDSEKEISEETINALIENLQMRLKLMYQLKAQLKKLDNLNTPENESNKA
ncbi:MAG: hypothetical protein KUG51_02715 [Urechidicola sp.]|nr:hypothetical protein [Urechidicola sp.]